MKTLRPVTLAVTLLLVFAGPVAADETPWCDMANCAMCKPFMAHPGLMQNMSMEYHDISDGMIQVASVLPAQMAAYKEAMLGMGATEKRIHAGENLPLCGMCQAFGTLMMSGAKQEFIPTSFGHVQMMRGATPEMVARIQAFAERTRTEMAKMAEAEKAEALE